MHRFLFLLLMASPLFAQSKEDSSRFFSTEIKVWGEVDSSQTLTLDSFSSFKVATLPAVVVRNHKGDSINLASNYKGVLLKDVLLRAKIKMKSVRDASNLIVIAKAPDGYLVTYSCHELFNTAVGDSVYILFEREGKPIRADDGGLFRMMSYSDFKNGARHFKWLSEIEVRKIQR